MRHWTLLADMYARVSRSAVNIGANAERRKLNHAELVKILPLLTDTTVPALRKALTPLMTWTEKDQPRTGVSAIRTLGKEEALKHWGDLMTATTKDVSSLDSEWMTKGHDLVKGELFARMRYLNWLDGHWKRRMATAKMGLSRLSTGDAAFDGDVKKTMDAYFAAVDAYVAGGWKVGMAAFEDKSLIDEPKLKAGVDGFKKSKKAFERSLKKIKLPKA